MKPPGVDGFVIFNNKFLLILRDNIPYIQNPNMWNLPGGGIEEEETEIEAFERELKEEINLIPSQKAVFIDTTPYEDGNIVSKFYVYIEENELDNLKLGEGQKMEFFTLDETRNLKIIPNLKKYISNNYEIISSIIKGR